MGRSVSKNYNVKIVFQRCTHFQYYSVLSLDGKANTGGCQSLTWDPFSHKKSMNYSGHSLNYYVKYQNKMHLSSLDTRRTLMHLFTNIAQRDLVSICTQRIRYSNYLYLPYNLALYNVLCEPFLNYVNLSCTV